MTYGGEAITVSLYKGGAVAGHCTSHIGAYLTETLSCDAVLADMIGLTVSGTQSTYLVVYEIAVSGVFNSAIGEYLFYLPFCPLLQLPSPPQVIQCCVTKIS